MAIMKNGAPILTLDEWGERAGPKRPDQWVENRSAMEAARSWLSVTPPRLPAEVEEILASHDDFGAVQSWEAEPEARLPFDGFPGEPRNSDLAVYARDRHGELVLAVEAKADEPFAETVAKTLVAAVERGLKNPRSNGVARVERLAAALLGPREGGAGEPSIGALRYQFLTAAAGALRAGEVRGATRVVLLVQEFVTSLTTDEKHRANGRDLDRFVHRLSHGSVRRVEPGVLYGPFSVPGAPLFEAPPPLYVGKAVVDLRSAGD